MKLKLKYFFPPPSLLFRRLQLEAHNLFRHITTAAFVTGDKLDLLT